MKARSLAIGAEFESIPESLIKKREAASRILQYIKNASSLKSTSLDRLYEDTIKFIDARIDYVQELTRIDGTAAQQKKSDSDAAWRSAIGAAISALVPKKEDEGLQGTKAVTEGTTTYFNESERREQNRKLDQSSALERAKTNYQRSKTDYLAAVEFTVGNAAKALAIPFKSTGFDTISNDIVFYHQHTLSTPEDLAELKRWLAKRPWDSFLHSIILRQMASVQALSLGSSEALAEECAALTDEFPKISIFDSDRAQVLNRSAEILEIALYRNHSAEQSWSNVKEPRSLKAANLRQRAMELDSSDPTGGELESSAWDLFLGGKFQESYDAAKQARSRPEFRLTVMHCLKNAQLSCILDRPDEALEWAKQLVVDQRYPNLKFIRTDSDLTLVRKEKKDDLEELLAVRWEWRVKFGVFNDDIILTNNSKAYLTNLVLNCHLVQGENTWDRHLTAKFVAPGESCTWSDAVSIPGSHLDRSTASLICDQGEDD